MVIGLIMLANASRIAAGDLALKESPILDTRAQARAEYLCKTDTFSHEGFVAADFSGLKFHWGGENLAEGFDDATSTNTAWMNSPMHRANILGKNFQQIGVGTDCGISVELFLGK